MMAPRKDIALDLDLILTAAFSILDAEGLEKLTMKRLGEQLSVRPSAFYWHYRNKAELLGLMGQSIYLRAASAVDASLDWRDWLRIFGERLHESLASHRDSARLIAIASPPDRPGGAQRARDLISPLRNFGLSESFALKCTSAVICFCVGWATYDENPGMHSLLGRILDFSDTFEFGLNALVSGFEGA